MILRSKIPHFRKKGSGGFFVSALLLAMTIRDSGLVISPEMWNYFLLGPLYGRRSCAQSNASNSGSL